MSSSDKQNIFAKKISEVFDIQEHKDLFEYKDKTVMQMYIELYMKKFKEEDFVIFTGTEENGKSCMKLNCNCLDKYKPKL